MISWKLLLITMTLLIGVGAGVLYVELANPAKIAVPKRTVEVRQLDSGYLVSCKTERNPYAFYEASSPTLEGSASEMVKCFKKVVRIDWRE